MERAAFRKEWVSSGIVTRLISELNAATKLNSDGGISFVKHDDDDLFFLIADGIIYPDNITRNDVSNISRRSFLDLRKQGLVRENILIAEIAKRIEKLQVEPRKKFTMWTKCRLQQMQFAKSSRFTVDGVNIRTASRLPKWLVLQEHFISGIGSINPNVLSNFGYIIFSTTARNENEASRSIFKACDLFYAIVNTAWRTIELWTQRRPTAKMWLGPNQFFFEEKKFICSNHIWYNQNYDEKLWSLFPPAAKDFHKKSRSFKRVLKSLENHPLKIPLQRALILISEGMASEDLSFRLMRFWSAAETLYSKESDRTNIKKLLSRLTFASKEDSWLDCIKLERSYHLRNSYVHKGSNESDDSSLVQHLRELLLIQIYYYIFNGNDIGSHSELLMMVDLPSKEIDLERYLVAVNRRINIAKTGRHSPKI